ncbi:glycoside hydrolase family 88 protein [Flavobacterium sp.]|uniref:glycoside hydrolase family 88 protein n=1 Tax=Flavobacterium sp. TaxID=239 RepID=UPI00120E09A1|nr:glycoside hydrolase family 88 protein [Flavobacterium sp.]RZJ70497.1 MAG: glycoside hydrolase [Flavobacterium sp.]
MTTRQLLVIAFLAAIGIASAQKKLDKKIDDALSQAQSQYSFLSTKVSVGKYPKTFVKGKLETSDSGWWCSGFYPGTLLYLDEWKANPKLKSEAQKVLVDLKREQFNKTTHDLGFMMYCSFGNAERQNPKKEYEEILMNSAKSLISRFNEKAGCIKSWDPAPWNRANADEMPVIIDNMMNLELLFWATKHSGDSIYYKIAKRHADTTIKNHFRPDYSSYHVVIYGIQDGKVRKQITNQGAGDYSAWARGQAWGLYGYTLMYRETKEKKYLDHAQKIANFILTNKNLPKDLIPYWDFDTAEIPNALRDSSAGAIIASALFELSKYSDEGKSKTYFYAAEQMLSALMTPKYLAKTGENGGFLLKHGVGNMPAATEIDTPLSYGDYYFVEACLRYKTF